MGRRGNPDLKSIVCLLALLAAATASAADLLDPEQAFRFSARALDGAVEVRFAIADGYYLYRDRFTFAADGSVKLGKPEYPPALPHKDEFFGEMPIYRGGVTLIVPVEGDGRFALKVVSQGCADAGVCYVPMESRAALRATGAASRPGPAEPGLSLYASDFEIARLLEGNFGFVLAGFLVLGLLLAFTPCMLPMIPILSGIIAGEGARLTKSRALALSCIYVFSMALTYAAAGVGAAYAGSLIASYLQNVWVLGAFALVFVVLALSMFGLYELHLPAFLEQRLYASQERLRGGRIASVAAMGVFSAVIVSPCVSAPLAGTLLQISRSGDVVLGGAALFALATGMGLPLIAVGVSEGALLPKAGPWMVAVRKLFGVLLLGVALWIVQSVIPSLAEMLAWAALLALAALVLRSLGMLGKVAAIGVLAGAIVLTAGALAGSRDPLQPLAAFRGQGAASSATPWTRVKSLAELEDRLRGAGRPVMLDFYADWCVSCKEMEKYTLTNPRVRASLERMLLLQADVTAATQADRELLKRFALFGPPGIIFFDAQGREMPELRVIGYQPSERFLKTLAAALRD
ncbi:MAG: protein-disulfide reductase DsbD [Betaproteobacteria bacterium]|nr:protein-disulfide reductase DsbD [Betaproteobacteria bacterium]